MSAPTSPHPCTSCGIVHTRPGSRCLTCWTDWQVAAELDARLIPWSSRETGRRYASFLRHLDEDLGRPTCLSSGFIQVAL